MAAVADDSTDIPEPQLDTSGLVAHPTWRHDNRDPVLIPFVALSEFGRGFLRAAKRAFPRLPHPAPCMDPLDWGYSALSSTALGRVADDEVLYRRLVSPGPLDEAVGARFFDQRREDAAWGFGKPLPALTPYLDLNARVCWREGL